MEKSENKSALLEYLALSGVLSLGFHKSICIFIRGLHLYTIFSHQFLWQDFCIISSAVHRTAWAQTNIKRPIGILIVMLLLIGIVFVRTLIPNLVKLDRRVWLIWLNRNGVCCWTFHCYWHGNIQSRRAFLNGWPQQHVGSVLSAVANIALASSSFRWFFP